MNAARALTVGNIVAIIAIAISLIAALAVFYYSRRVEAEKDIRIAEANSNAAKAVEGQRRLESENLKLQLAIEQERTARELLNAQVGQRSLSADQQRTLLENLRPHAGRSITIKTLTDREAAIYGAQVERIFHEAGWIVVRATGIVSPPPYGFVVSSTPAAPMLPVVLSALQRAGLPVVRSLRERAATPGRPDDEVQLLVGLKPPVK